MFNSNNVIILLCFAYYVNAHETHLCDIENDPLWYCGGDCSLIPEYEALMSGMSRSSDDVEEHVHFLLHTRSVESNPILFDDKKSLDKSGFKMENIVVLIIHGWSGNGANEMNSMLTKAFLEDGDVNVISVDWGVVAAYNYISASFAVSSVGEVVVKFLDWLVTEGVSYDNVHIVGFSLGAHIAGNIGRETGSKIRRITALDPAGVFWDYIKGRVVKTDAQYVEVIHTNTKFYGYNGPCGHADFYPNGGAFMPNCDSNACSHSMAYHYMAHSIQMEMIARYCQSIDEVVADSCNGDEYPMGNSDLSKNRPGLFRINIPSSRRSYESALCNGVS